MNKEKKVSKWLSAYKKLNKSFKSVLVFHIGESAGFFSEYNCMILAMLYCLQHRIQFKLYSMDANFGYEKGWTDYFEPFCDIVNNPIHKYVNMRSYGLKGKLNFKKWNFLKWQLKKRLCNIFIQILKPVMPFSYCTQDIWDLLFKPEMMKQQYYIPELDISGDLVQACNRLVEITWRFNVYTKIEIDTIVSQLNLPQLYISCQIRGGDKILETDLLPIEIYVDQFEKQKSIKNIFVLTDDYRIIEQLISINKWNILTLCDKIDKGYVHAEFRKEKIDLKRRKLINLFSAIECCSKSSMFIGTKRSNPSVFLLMYRSCICNFIDKKEDLNLIILNRWG